MRLVKGDRIRATVKTFADKEAVKTYECTGVWIRGKEVVRYDFIDVVSELQFEMSVQMLCEKYEKGVVKYATKY